MASLEKKAEKNILDSIDKLVTNSFLMLLFESLMVKNHPILKDTLKEKSVKGIYSYVNQVISNLRHIVDEGGDEKEFHLRKSLQMKEKILEIYDVVKIYLSACSIIDLFFEDQMQFLEGAEQGEESMPELKKLFRLKIERFLNDGIKHDVEEAASAILFTILPNHLTDKELIDYVAYSGQFYFENSCHKKGMEHISQIMKSFAPQKAVDFGKYYRREAESLYNIIEKVRTTGVTKDLKRTLNRYDKIYTKIEGIADVLSSLYTEFTYITILLSSMFTFDDILKGDPVYTDYYNKTIELVNTEEVDEVVSEALLTSLDRTIEAEVEKLNELAKRKEIIYKNIDFEKFSENTKTLFSMEFFMTTAFFENIEDTGDIEAGLTDTEAKKYADFKTIQKEIKMLKLFMKENCLGMSEALKKSARRNLFLSVPLVSFYDKEKMMKYIDSLCDKSDIPSEIETALIAIEKMTEENLLEKLAVFE